MFDKFTKWLRGFGAIGSFAANVITFYPGLTMSTVIGALIAKYTSAIEWVQQPGVYSCAGIFLFILWTYIGIDILRKQKQIQTIRVAHDYAYSLIMDTGGHPIFGKFPPTHLTNPNREAISLSLQFRNVGAGPLRLKVEECRVVLNGRTGDDLETPLIMTFARLAPKGLQIGGILRENDDTHLFGTANFKFIYGPPDGDFVRAFTLKLKIQVAIDALSQPSQIAGGLIMEIVEEKDEPYVHR